MAYGCGYATGYADTCDIPIQNICIPLGYGSGPYAVMAYAGYQICSFDTSNVVVVTPKSNVRDLCLARC